MDELVAVRLLGAEGSCAKLASLRSSRSIPWHHLATLVFGMSRARPLCAPRHPAGSCHLLRWIVTAIALDPCSNPILPSFLGKTEPSLWPTGSSQAALSLVPLWPPGHFDCIQQVPASGPLPACLTSWLRIFQSTGLSGQGLMQ